MIQGDFNAAFRVVEYPYCTLATNQTTHTKQYRTHLSKNIDCFCEPYLPCFDMFVDSRNTVRFNHMYAFPM